MTWHREFTKRWIFTQGQHGTDNVNDDKTIQSQYQYRLPRPITILLFPIRLDDLGASDSGPSERT